MELQLTPYSWRGKRYKSLRGLFNAVDKAFGPSTISFGVTTMRVRSKDGTREFQVIRNHSGRVGELCNDIAAEPLRHF